MTNQIVEKLNQEKVSTEIKNNFPEITQYPSPVTDKLMELTDQEKIEQISSKMADIMEILGLDLNHPSLEKTPQRVAKMYVKEIFSGLNPTNFPEITLFEEDSLNETSHSVVTVKSEFVSFCEHHLIPMQGTAYVAYLPNKKLIGLSKIPRIIRYFSQRPQLQERLTAQIADSLTLLLETEDVAVSLTANHLCMTARGIREQNSQTETQVLRGIFLDDSSLRSEFLEKVR